MDTPSLNPPPVPSQIGVPSKEHYLSISELDLDISQIEIIKNFRTDRYFWLNEYRWRLLAKTGISFEGKSIFEPAAGIGDQTAWLLNSGAAQVVVSDGRQENLEIVTKRFRSESRVTTVLGDIEQCLDSIDFKLNTDLVYLWGAYYHILDPVPEFPILHKLSKIAPMIVMDFQMSLTGMNYIRHYAYENVSASISHSSWAQTAETMAAGIRQSFGYAYFPIEQMNWDDPSTLSAPRRIIIGSQKPLSYPGLIEAK